MRPEDFTVVTDYEVSLCWLRCPVPGCHTDRVISKVVAPGLDADLGSLLDAARGHLTTRHPTEGPDHEMRWNDTVLRTTGDLSDAIHRIIKTGTREQAQQFMATYRAANEHADTNVGYLAGYFDPDTAKTIWDWFGCEHPVFGTTVPSTDEALEAGRSWGTQP